MTSKCSQHTMLRAKMRLQLHHVNPEELKALLLPFLGCSCPFSAGSCAPGAALLPRGSAGLVWHSCVTLRAQGRWHALTHGHTAKEGVRVKNCRLSIVTFCIHRSQIELNSFKVSEPPVMMSEGFWH